MGFTTGDLPPVDPETFAERPLFERIRILSTHWVEYGFGTPKMVHVIYIVKLLVLYICRRPLRRHRHLRPRPVLARRRRGGQSRSSTRSSSCGRCCSRRSGWPARGDRSPATSSR